jgi:hypothetical protein
MHRVLLAALALVLIACDGGVEKAFDLVTGRETNVVVLVDKPTQLGPSSATFSSSKEPMKVLGEWSSLCLSLRGDVPLQEAKVMDRVFAEALGNAKVKVELTLANGARVTLRHPLQAWSMHGRIVERNELSACASTPCKTELPVGAQVSKVDPSSDLPLTVQGIYWKSETDLPKPPSAKQQVASASSPKARSACSA